MNRKADRRSKHDEAMRIAEAIRIDPQSNVSVHRQIADRIRAMIHGGRLTTGRQLPTHKQLAQALSLHPMTVNLAYQVLQKGDLIRQYRGRGSFVLPLKTEQSTRVVVLLPPWSELQSYAWGAYQQTQFLAGIEEGLKAKAISLSILTLPHHATEADLEGLALDITGKYQGLFACLTAEQLPLVRRLARMQFTVVSYQRVADFSGVSSATYDRRQAMYLATVHLIQSGRSRIGYMGPRTDDPVAAGWFNGYLKALEEFGLPYLPATLLRCEFTEPSRRAAIEQAVREQRLGDGLVTVGHGAAPIALQVLQAHGIAVPRDIAVVGYDEPGDGAKTQPPLTWIYVPRYEMGLLAADIMIRHTSHQSVQVENRLAEARLISGRSCGHPVSDANTERTVSARH